MTDPDTGGGAGVRDAGPDRLTMVLGGGLAVVLLAAVGATGGWILAGEKNGGDAPAAAASGLPTTALPSVRPTRQRSTPAAPRTTASTPRATGLTVPPVVGRDFTDARDELRDRRLGWRLVFLRGSGTTVERTSPTVGTPVEPGRTVTLYVSGPAPEATVPGVVGEECAEAAEELDEDGFHPLYRHSRSGTVTRQDPPEDTVGRWNDRVSIWCGVTPEESASASPTP